MGKRERSFLNRSVLDDIIFLGTSKLMYRYGQIPDKLKLQHPLRAIPWAFELLKVGLFKFPPLGAKSHSSTPPISTEIPLLKGKFRL